jgi:ADP-heptose:LPS heptosyltransferase
MSGGKILVIRGGAIGDFILTLPALSALRNHFPQARLAVLGYPHIAQLALAGGLADEVRSIEARPLAGFFAQHGTLAQELQDYFAGCAVILSYLYDPDQIFQSNVARCSPAQFIACPHRPDEKTRLHATEVFLKPLERLAIFSADLAPRLNLAPRDPSLLPARVPGSPNFEPNNLPSGRDAAWAESHWLAVHPGSGSEGKNWPESRWTELLQSLAQTTAWQFLLVGGEAEEGRLERLARALPEPRIEWARNLALPELARRLAACSAFLGHDSGITHLAAAVGLPGLVLWGESVAAVWRPLSEGMIILREPGGLAQLPVARVRDQLDALLATT